MVKQPTPESAIPMFDGGSRHEYAQDIRINPEALGASKDSIKPVSIDLAQRSINLVEAIDRIAVAGRNMTLSYASTTEPTRQKILESYGSEADAYRVSKNAAKKIDEYLSDGKVYFGRALGVMALADAGLKVKKGSDQSPQTQAELELNREWRNFLQTYSGPRNAKRREQKIRVLRAVYRSVTGKPMPKRSLQLDRANTKAQKNQQKAA